MKKRRVRLFSPLFFMLLIIYDPRKDEYNLISEILKLDDDDDEFVEAYAQICFRIILVIFRLLRDTMLGLILASSKRDETSSKLLSSYTLY